MKVLEFLHSNTIEQLSEQLGIKVSRTDAYPDLYVLNYNQIDSPKTHPIVCECRSLVLESLDGIKFTVVSRSFDRFFNYGEAGYSPDISTLICHEKIDGSLIGVFFYRGEWLYRTKSVVEAILSINGFEKTWDSLIKPLLDLENSSKFMDTSLTYIFEVVGRENRVVVKYDIPAIYLLAVRETESGRYL